MQSLSPLEQTVISAIDMDSMLAVIDKLVSVRSLDGTPEEITCQLIVADLMQFLGLDVSQWAVDMDELTAHPAYSAEVDRDTMPGVVGMYGGDDGKVLLLNGHTDVVPAGEIGRWDYDPWRATLDEDTGRLYGRGAVDMKGALCCGIFAIKAIMDSDVALDGKVILEAVFGEEDGGSGTLATILHGITADACIVMEPTELMIAPAQAGAYNFRIQIPGQAAHGALRHEGVDPLTKFLPIYQAILDLEIERNTDVQHPMFQDYAFPYPICVGTAGGGSWASSVMETFTFEGRYGIQIGEDPQQAIEIFEAKIAAVAAADDWLRDNPPTIEWWGGQFDPAEIEQDHPLVTATSAAYTDTTGQEPTLRGMPYGADMRLLINEGHIPTLMFGPGDVRMAHRPDEYVPVDELRICAETLAVTIMRFCGVAEEKAESATG